MTAILTPVFFTLFDHLNMTVFFCFYVEASVIENCRNQFNNSWCNRMKLITVYINTNLILFYPLDTRNAIEHTHGGFLTMVFHLKYPTQLGITENYP